MPPLLSLPILLPLTLLLVSFAELWVYLVPFVSALLAAGTGWIIAVLSMRRTDAHKQSQETVAEKKAWRDAREAAEKIVAESLAKESQERMFYQLENSADLERVTSILKDFGDVQRLLAVVAADSQHHAADIASLNRRIEAATQHLNDFILRHVSKSS